MRRERARPALVDGTWQAECLCRWFGDIRAAADDTDGDWRHLTFWCPACGIRWTERVRVDS